MYVNIDCQILANLRIILYKECNKRDVGPPVLLHEHFKTFSTYSQGAERTKVHVYLPYRGAISFYVYIVPLGLISIFLYVGRVQISCGLLPTRFCSISL